MHYFTAGMWAGDNLLDQKKTLRVSLNDEHVTNRQSHDKCLAFTYIHGE